MAISTRGNRCEAAVVPRHRPRPVPVQLDDGETVGHLRLFNDPLLSELNVVVNLRGLAAVLACLEAAGAAALERCGAILDSRIFEEAP